MTAISSTHEKDAAARDFGAHHTIATRGTDELAAAARSFDFIAVTASGDLPWDAYLQALRPGGKLCIVGIPPAPVAFSIWNLVGDEKSVVGGQPGSIDETAQMLRFVARHGIRPSIETFPMHEANAALEHTRRGNARFRTVLVANES